MDNRDEGLPDGHRTQTNAERGATVPSTLAIRSDLPEKTPNAHPIADGFPMEGDSQGLVRCFEQRDSRAVPDVVRDGSLSP
jgi:hypothetical protein